MCATAARAHWEKDPIAQQELKWKQIGERAPLAQKSRSKDVPEENKGGNQIEV